MKTLFNFIFITINCWLGILSRKKRVAVVINCGLGNSILVIPLLKKLAEENPDRTVHIFGSESCLKLLQPVGCAAEWTLLSSGTSILMHALTSNPVCLKRFDEVVISFNSSDPGFGNLKRLGLTGNIVKAAGEHYNKNRASGSIYHEAIYNIITLFPEYSLQHPEISLEVSEDELERADEYLSGKGLKKDSFIALHAGYKPDFMIKAIPPGILQELINSMVDQNIKVALVIGPDESHVWEKISSAMNLREAPVLIDDIEDPRLLGAALAQAKCLISADTGVAHLTAACGGRTCVIFGPTSDVRCIPLGKYPATVIKPDCTCLNCYEKYSSRACFQDKKCLCSLGVSDIIKGILND